MPVIVSPDFMWTFAASTAIQVARRRRQVVETVPTVADWTG